jgi:hypothetical protein
MSNWQDYLKADPLPWLLEEDNPSVRYFTLTDILDRPADDAEVIAAQKDIMTRGDVPDLLEGLTDDGTGSRLLFLTGLGIHDARMQDAVDRLVRKQNKLGQWRQQRTYPKTRWAGHMPIPIDTKGEPSKWVTLRALTALKRYYV